MTTAIDTNVIIGLWDRDPGLNMAAQNALDAAFRRGTLVAAAPVFAELIAAPGRGKAFVDSFFEETGIGVDWELPEQVWRLAGRAYQPYAERRREQRDRGARRILADFVFGAHALANGSASSPLTKECIGLLPSTLDRDILRFFGRRSDGLSIFAINSCVQSLPHHKTAGSGPNGARFN